MDMGGYGSIISATTGVIAAIGGAILYILRVIREIRKSKSAEADRLLDEAKSHGLSIKTKLEAKIDLLENQLNNLEENVAKDIGHLKETQSSEIKNLANKIEDLREELLQGHGSLVALLTKLVDKN